MTPKHNILVTGGAGFIGSVVATQLVDAGHHVVVLDNLSKGHRSAVPARAQLVVGDLGDCSLISSTLRQHKIDAVMHFAASIEAGESMRHPAKFFQNNTANALNLLESVVECGVQLFVFSSTAALYGEPKRTPLEETDELCPISAYGESKLLVERMLGWFHRVHGIRYASMRYFNAAGATPAHGEAHHPETHLIPLVLQIAAGVGDRAVIFGTDYPTFDGTCIRDYVHVSDLASAHVLALNALAGGKGHKLVYNLGNGSGFSVRQVIESSRRVTGHRIPITEMPRRSGDPAVLVASCERIRKELGWTPRFTDLDDIVGSAWEWSRNHPHGYGESSR